MRYLSQTPVNMLRWAQIRRGRALLAVEEAREYLASAVLSLEHAERVLAEEETAPSTGRVP